MYVQDTRIHALLQGCVRQARLPTGSVSTLEDSARYGYRKIRKETITETKDSEGSDHGNKIYLYFRTKLIN